MFTLLEMWMTTFDLGHFLHYDNKKNNGAHFGPLKLVTVKEAFPSTFTGCETTDDFT